MKPLHMFIGAVIAAGLLYALAVDLVDTTSGTKGLENAHRAAGYEPKCSTLEDAGQTWALCDIGRASPGAWLQRGEAWASGNGVAQGVVNRLQQTGPGAYNNLPRLYVDRDQVVTMPAKVLERL